MIFSSSIYKKDKLYIGENILTNKELNDRKKLNIDRRRDRFTEKVCNIKHTKTLVKRR